MKTRAAGQSSWVGPLQAGPWTRTKPWCAWGRLLGGAAGQKASQLNALAYGKLMLLLLQYCAELYSTVLCCTQGRRVPDVSQHCSTFFLHSPPRISTVRMLSSSSLCSLNDNRLPLLSSSHCRRSQRRFLHQRMGWWPSFSTNSDTETISRFRYC